jgi:polysaccharide pyruvyl transferase WcaK-like protein
VTNLASLDLFIGMRLHALILSSLVGSLPTSAISYDEKTDALQSVFGEQFFRIADIIEHPEDVAKLLIGSLDHSQSTVDWTNIRASSESLVSELKSLFSDGKID